MKAKMKICYIPVNFAQKSAAGRMTIHWLSENSNDKVPMMQKIIAAYLKGFSK